MNAQSLLPLLALAAAMMACDPTPPTAPDAAPAASLPSPTAANGSSTNARTGTFAGLAGHRASGSVRLEVNGNVGTIIFGGDFASDGVPGPFVYLNSVPDVNRGAPLRISALRSPIGAQSYSFRIPSGVSYAYVIVWCDPFNVGVAAAALSP